jgi:hypothetical protein
MPLRIRLGGLIGVIAYAVLLGAAQVLVITPAFGYQGFSYGRPDVWTLLAVGASYILAASQLPAALTRPSQVTYWLLFLLVVAPVHVTPLVLNLTGRAQPLPIIVAVSASFWILGLVGRLPPPQLRVPGVPAPLFWGLAGAMLAVGVGICLIEFGLHFYLPSFADVSDVRREFKTAVRMLGGIGLYAISWVTGVLAPLFVVAGIVRRKLSHVLVGLGSQVVVYSLTGFRSALLSIALLIVMVVLSHRRTAAMVGTRLGWGAAVGVGLIAGFDYVNHSIHVSSLLIRRLALTSGVNTYQYYEYFVDRPKAHLGYGILSGIFPYAYDTDPAHLIGRVYYHDPSTSANANVFADAFVNFGFAGIIGFTLLLGCFMWLYDGIAARRDLRMSALLITVPSFVLTNTALFTTLLTHGLLLALLLLMLMPEAVQRSSLAGEPTIDRMDLGLFAAPVQSTHHGATASLTHCRGPNGVLRECSHGIRDRGGVRRIHE